MRMSMVSAACGSFHSYCGGTVDDDEFDSRAPSDTISSFLYDFPPPQPPQTSPSVFDPFSTLDNTKTLTNRNPPPPPSPATNCSADKASASPQPPASRRHTKKRTRTLQRVPTTVLTTDTSNFRTMVHEFTGIPMPPFVPSSRPRLNLLQTASTASPTSYLLRPFSQKLQHTAPSTSGGSNQNKDVNLHSLYQHQQEEVTTPMSNPGMLQWSSGYGAGGELGSFSAGSYANTDTIGSCDPETKAEAGRRSY